MDTNKSAAIRSVWFGLVWFGFVSLLLCYHFSCVSQFICPSCCLMRPTIWRCQYEHDFQLVFFMLLLLLLLFVFSICVGHILRCAFFASFFNFNFIYFTKCAIGLTVDVSTFSSHLRWEFVFICNKSHCSHLMWLFVCLFVCGSVLHCLFCELVYTYSHNRIPFTNGFG